MTDPDDQRSHAKYVRLIADIAHCGRQLSAEHAKKRPNYTRIARLTQDLTRLKEQRANEYGPRA